MKKFNIVPMVLGFMQNHRNNNFSFSIQKINLYFELLADLYFVFFLE